MSIRSQRFQLLQGGGSNPVKDEGLPSIIFFDAPETHEERETQRRAVVEHDRWLRGIRGVISSDIAVRSDDIAVRSDDIAVRSDDIELDIGRKL